MRYAVNAIALDPQTGDVIAAPRVEVIDTSDPNELFYGIDGPWAVEDRYEAFWNRLNPSWERDFPRGKEKVKVLSVRAL